MIRTVSFGPATSAGVGQGSEFVVRLPSAAPPLSASEQNPTIPTTARSRHLLIIEDNTGGQDHSLNAVMSVMPYRLAGWVGPNRAYVRADANDVFDRARAFLQ